MVADLVFDFFVRSSVARKGVADASKRDSLLVVHDVEQVVVDCGAGSDAALTFERPINVNRGFIASALIANELHDALSCGVVEVLSVKGRRSAAGLHAKDTHAIALIPFEMAFGVLLGQISGSIVRITVRSAPDGQLTQAVVSRDESQLPIRR